MELKDIRTADKNHLNILKKHFGHDSFKTEQWQAISEIMYEQRDVFISARSGFGKSLIYQYPTVFLKKRSLVISPLISLMETQVQSLQSRGIAACLVSGQQKNININLKDYSIIYTTPENFKTVSGIFRFTGGNEEICLIAIDEVHCISKLSPDHRPAFSIVKNIKEFFPNIPIVALTSTTTKETTANILSILQLKNPLMLTTSLNRPNIQYISIPQTTCFITDVKRYLLDIPKSDAAIIYVFKRAETENFSQILTREGFDSKPYNSGLTESTRKETLSNFMSGKLNFLVTTNAFGMGVDRKNVRVVIHYGVSKSLDTYYTESGRVGRDDKPAKAIVFWSDRDYKFHNFCFKENLKKKIISYESYAHCQALLGKMQEYTVVKSCRRSVLLSFLEETIPPIISDSCCDNCLQTLHEKVGLKKMYKGIKTDGVLDITDDARLVLRLIQSYDGKCKSEFLLDFIAGTSLPSIFNPKHPVEFFGCGRNKPKSWWLNVLKAVKEKRYTERHMVVANTHNIIELIAGISRDDYIRATRKGLGFIRCRTDKFICFIESEFLHSMAFTDTEYYIINDEIKEKPRLNSIKQVSDGPESIMINEAKSFDFSAFSTHLNKSSPRKRIASESEFSDISLNELFKSPKKEDEGSPKSPKLPKLSETCLIDLSDVDSGEPGCSHWCKSNGDVEMDGEQNNSSEATDVPLLNSLDGKFERASTKSRSDELD